MAEDRLWEENRELRREIETLKAYIGVNPPFTPTKGKDSHKRFRRNILRARMKGKTLIPREYISPLFPSSTVEKNERKRLVSPPSHRPDTRYYILGPTIGGVPRPMEVYPQELKLRTRT